MALLSIDAAGGADAATIAAAVAAAVPNAAAIQAAVVAALTSEVAGPFGALYSLINPGDPYALNPTTHEPLTGAFSYVIGAAGFGKHILYGWSITSDTGCNIQWWSGSPGVQLTCDHDINAATPWDIAPGSRQTIITNSDDALILKVSDDAAVIRVTAWHRFVEI